MSIEREQDASSAFLALSAQQEEVRAALDRVSQAQIPKERKEAALRIGLDFPGIRSIGYLLELMKEDPQHASNFLVLRVADAEARAFIQRLADRLMGDNDLLLSLRDVMPASFPLPAGPPLQPLKARLRILADNLEPLWRKLHELGYVEQAKPMHDLIDDCRSFAFRVYVIGEWSSGKSTLINALLGQELLPTGFVPVTPAPTRIRYGERPRLFLKRRDEEQESEQPPEVLTDLCLPTVGQETATENARLLNLEYIRVETPASFCANGIELVDTPGLNEVSQQTTLVTQLLPLADAVLLVLRANQPLTAVELEVLRQATLQPLGRRRWLDAGFVVFTFTDVVLRDRRNRGAIEQVKARAESMLRELNPPMGFAYDRQYWIDAQAALAAKLESPESQDLCLKDFARLEQALQAFLAQGRGPQMEAGRREQAVQQLIWGKKLLDAERTSIRQGQRLSEEECQQLAQRIQELSDKGQKLAQSLREKSAEFAEERGALLTAYAKKLEPPLLEYMKTVTFPGKVVLGPRKAAEHFAIAGQDWLKDEIRRWSQEKLHPAMEHFLRPFLEQFEILRNETGAVGAALLLPEGLFERAIPDSAIEGVVSESVLGSSLFSLLGGVLGLGVGAAVSIGLLLPSAIPLGIVVGAVLGFLRFTFIGEDGRQGKLRDAVMKELVKQLGNEEIHKKFIGGIIAYFGKIAEAMQAITTRSTLELKEQLALQQQLAALEEEKRAHRLTVLEQTATAFDEALTRIRV